MRNSQVYEIFKNLNNNYKVDIHDPLALNSEVKIIYNKKNEKILKKNHYNLIIIAVSHKIFKKIGIKKIQNLLLNKDKKNIIDVKSMFDVNTFVDVKHIFDVKHVFDVNKKF